MCNNRTKKETSFLLRISTQKKWKWFSRWVFPFLIGGFFGLLDYITEEAGKGFDWQIFIYKILFAYVLLDVPQMILEETSKLSEKVENELGRIKEISHFTAFNTEGNVFGKQINVLNDTLTQSSHKWIYSKYISKLLSISFDSFKIQFASGEMGTREYSKFSTEVMKECTSAVFLTGSMTPYEWLSYLAINDDEEKHFFNNTRTKLEFDSENHSITLGNLQIPVKRRAVCLSEFDYDHLFLSELSIKEYYRINTQKKGIITTFCKWTESLSSRYSKMVPSDYEYAWYDRTLLFKFGKKTKELEVLREGPEYDAVKKFFEDIERGNGMDTNEETLIQNVKSEKIKLLSNIADRNWQIPHKYSYLLNDTWVDFLRNSLTFDSSAKISTSILFGSFLKDLNIDNVNKLDIVEIGAGIGDKSLSLCERILNDKIRSYKLIDISQPLLDDAQLLLNQDPRLKGKVSQGRFDCCDGKSTPRDCYRNKTVLLLNNSTIFSEKGFPWQLLQSSQRIFITLHILENNSNEKTFNEYLKARSFFLAPLKIFGIPITDELLYSERCNCYFNNNGDVYTNDNPFYNITFNLKKYLEELPSDIKDAYKKIKKITEERTKYKSRTLTDFEQQTNIVVLSSLKFRKDDTEWIDKAKQYFYIQLGDKEMNTWNISIKENDSFIGVWIERKPAGS